MQETWAQSLGWEDLLEKEMTIYCSILAWEIPCTEELGRLQRGFKRVRYDLATKNNHLYYKYALFGSGINSFQGIKFSRAYAESDNGYFKDRCVD